MLLPAGLHWYYIEFLGVKHEIQLKIMSCMFVYIEGVHCESDFDECHSDPCENGGTCLNLHDQYRCACRNGYEGTNCQNDVDECESSPCLNGGACTHGVGSYSCECGDDTVGNRCQTNPCDDAPCQNNGSCTVSETAFTPLSSKPYSSFYGISRLTNRMPGTWLRLAHVRAEFPVTLVRLVHVMARQPSAPMEAPARSRLAEAA